jgi:hypothetical protein
MKHLRPLPTALLEQLVYDHTTGALFWLARNMRQADRIGSDGYRHVSFPGHIPYFAHRVAWALFYETDPYPRHIDHKDTNRSNNVITNLRLATLPQNQSNRGKQSNNTSGHKGVSWDKCAGKWRAEIKIQGKKVSLGYFYDLEDAALAYKAAADSLLGEWARY